MPKSNKERQAALRKRRAVLGQKRREFFLTDGEKERFDELLRKLRKEK
jgi:hypothetical protein